MLSFNSSDLNKVGNGIIGLSQETRAVVNDIKNTMDRSVDFWRDKSNDEFILNIDTYINEITKLLDRYDSTGKGVTEIASNLENNTQENANRIRNVQY